MLRRPLYYGTGRPHLGSLYSTVLADVANRWYKLLGYKTFFLTGTDEHGQKIAEAAHKAGKSPKEFVDVFVADYKKTWKDYHIDYSKFIRTTDEEHKQAVKKLVNTLLEKGDVYKGSYEGWYCTPCETFVPGEKKKKMKDPCVLLVDVQPDMFQRHHIFSSYLPIKKNY